MVPMLLLVTVVGVDALASGTAEAAAAAAVVAGRRVCRYPLRGAIVAFLMLIIEELSLLSLHSKLAWQAIQVRACTLVRTLTAWA